MQIYDKYLWTFYKKSFMMKVILVFITVLLISCEQKKSEKRQQGNNTIEVELIGVQKWFDAWELVANDILKISSFEPPLMLFYDETFVYTNTKEEIENSLEIKGPQFFGKKEKWVKYKHNDKLTLPNGQITPIKVMSFAGKGKKGSNQIFFVMGTPSFWKQNQIQSDELGDKNLYTGIFLHEFAHSQQNKNFGKRLQELENNISPEINLNDDMVQKEMEGNRKYNKAMKAEINLFYDAFWAIDSMETRRIANNALEMYKERQSKYFVGNKETLKLYDDFFLTMEGIGQYVAIAWLTNPKGANLNIEIAVNGIRRNKKWWSQDEGLAMFLLYNKQQQIAMGKSMFGSDLRTINKLIEGQFH